MSYTSEALRLPARGSSTGAQVRLLRDSGHRGVDMGTSLQGRRTGILRKNAPRWEKQPGTLGQAGPVLPLRGWSRQTTTKE